jgi:hypothetical protein
MTRENLYDTQRRLKTASDSNFENCYNFYMSGFLDPYAVSIKAEYTRYLDADLLGKIVFKNFALNVLKVDEESIRIPLSRQGDLGTYKDSCDAGIRFENRSYSVETKSSRWIVAKRCKIDPKPRWSFSGLKHSAKGTERGNYDLVFAVGINAPGLEDSLGYWRHLHSLKKTAEEEGRDFDLSVWPHEPEFLNMCGIYILPRQFIFTHCKNTQDITIRTLSERRDFGFFGWGHDIPRLRKIWQRAIRIVNSPSNADSQI